jgi:hypothetical protein
MQQFFILVFFMLAIQFHRRVLVLERQDVLISNGKTEWRRLLYTLYASLILITVGFHQNLRTLVLILALFS